MFSVFRLLDCSCFSFEMGVGRVSVFGSSWCRLCLVACRVPFVRFVCRFCVFRSSRSIFCFSFCPSVCTFGSVLFVSFHFPLSP